MKSPLILAALLAFSLAACNTRKCNDLPNPETGDYFGERRNCPDDNVCTMNFVAVTLNVKDAAGAPVALDSFVVTNRAGVPVPPNAAGNPVWGENLPQKGFYTVLSDGWVYGHEGLGSYFVAKGFKNGRQLVNETYAISADCCHIRKISGNDEVVVN